VNREPDLDRVKKACSELGEHFDTVQIFVTRHEPSEGGTVNVQWGEGNWFARYGQVKSWTISEDEAFREDPGKDRE
jgi:hypothetical protein